MCKVLINNYCKIHNFALDLDLWYFSRLSFQFHVAHNYNCNNRYLTKMTPCWQVMWRAQHEGWETQQENPQQVGRETPQTVWYTSRLVSFVWFQTGLFLYFYFFQTLYRLNWRWSFLKSFTLRDLHAQRLQHSNIQYHKCPKT